MANPQNDSYSAIAGAVIYGGRTAAGAPVDPTPGGLPLWAANAPLNAWMEIPGTAVGSLALFDTYSGWAKLPNGEISFALGGGHGDGQKNNVVKINLLADAPAWNEVCPESPVHVDDVAYQPDGKPTSSHLYYTLMWVPSTNRLMRIGCRFASGAATMQYPTVDGFDFDTATWDAAGTHPATGGGFGVMLNPVTNKVLIVGEYTARYFDPVTGASTALTLSGVPYMPQCPWCWDSNRSQAFGLSFGDGQGSSTFLGLVAAKISGTAVTPIVIAPSAARTQFIADAPMYAGIDYDPDHDWFLIYEGRDAGENIRIYKVIPNSTGTWDMEMFTLASGGVVPTAVVQAGLMNKFTHMPEIGGFVMHTNVSSNLYFLRTK